MANDLTQTIGHTPLSENHWNRITSNSMPHEMFNLDWSTYSAKDFGNTFLPKLNIMGRNYLAIKDGAKLFSNSQYTDATLKLYNNIISLNIYTYPKGVLAQNKRRSVQVTEYEVATFIETDIQGNLEIYFLFGTEFKNYLDKYFKDNNKPQNTAVMEQQIYTTTFTELTTFFNNSLGHYTMMSFILKTLGVNTLNASTNSLVDSLNDLVIFFRSIDQANGYPTTDTSRSITYDKKNYPGIKHDAAYLGTFGFDLYMPELYDVKTEVYNAEPVITDNVLESKSVKSGKILEDYYREVKELNLSLKDQNGTDFYISKDYKLQKGSVGIENNTYFAPNLMIAPGKEITIYAKKFTPDKKELIVSVELSSEKGIENYTKQIVFPKNKDTLELKIQTKTNEVIEQPTLLSLKVDNKIIGSLTILPNKLLVANYFFVNVIYKSTTKPDLDPINTITTLNNTYYSQASVLLKKVNKTKNILTLLPGSGIADDNGNITQLLSNVIENNKILDLDKVLGIVQYEFNKSISLQILSNLDQKLRLIMVEDSNNTLHPLIKPDETLETIMKFENKYYVILNKLINFLTNWNINLFNAFLCSNITSNGNPAAIGNYDGTSLIIPENAFDDETVIAHEIGHNLNLAHTFKTINSSLYDLDLPIMKSKENIMDYLPKQNKKNFITFQWEKIRETLTRRSNTFEFTISNKQREGFFHLTTEDPISNSTFSRTLFLCFNAYNNQKHQASLNFPDEEQRKILEAITESITETFNNLCDLN